MAKIENMTPWEFACQWYQVDTTHRSILRESIPVSVHSYKFAEWLTHQYRLAMNKGIELGMEAQREADRQVTPKPT
jgi:hypothetical protein